MPPKRWTNHIKTKKYITCIVDIHNTCTYCKKKWESQQKYKVVSYNIKDSKVIKKPDRKSYTLCNKCSEYPSIMKGLYKDKIVSDYVLIAYYDVDGQTHSGYCSDPYDIEEVDISGFLIYYIPKSFYGDGIQQEIIKKMCPFLDIDTIYHGNGYCGCEKNYTLINMEVIPKDSIPKESKLALY